MRRFATTTGRLSDERRFSEPSFVSPPDEPELAGWADAFDPDVIGVPLSGAPEIARWTDQAQPGDSVVLCGTFASDAKFWVHSNGGLFAPTTIVRQETGCAVLTLPISPAANSPFLLAAKDSAGKWSRPVLIGKAQARWAISHETASASVLAGDTVSIFGVNLSKALAYPYDVTSPSTKCMIWLYPAGGAGQYVTCTAITPYRAQFVMPALAAGAVDVYVHNGHGGVYGWSGPIALTVTTRAALGIDYDHNVTNMGAPNGTDDTTAFTNAITAVGNDGPFDLVLQSGTYKISAGFALSGGLGKAGRIRGQGSGSTTIQLLASFTSSNSRSIRSTVQSELKDLTFDASLVGASEQATLGIFRLVNVVQVYANTNVYSNVISGGGAALITGGSITGPGVFMTSPTGVFIDNVDMFGTNLTDSLIVVWGGRNICVTNNTWQHLNPAGTNAQKGHGRGYVGAATNYGTQRCVHISGNTTPTRFDNPEGFGDGETILSDGALSDASTLATAATANTVTITATASAGWINTRDAVIVAGKGRGQSREITGVSGNTLTVDRNWDVIPDTTSLINVVGFWANVVIYDNSATGGNILDDGSEQGDSQGVNVFTGGSDITIDGCAFTDMHYGRSEWSVGATGSLTRLVPLLFTLAKNNTYDHCNYGLRTVADDIVGSETINVFGNVRRDEVHTDTVVTGWYLLRGANSGPINLDVWQGCSLVGEKFGIYNAHTSTQAIGSDIIDTAFTGSNVAGSLAKRNVTVSDHGTTAYTNFEG